MLDSAKKTATAGKKAVREHFTYDVTFQLRIIRVLYQEPDYAVSVSHFLSHEHFEKRLHRWLAKELLEYARKHGTGVTRDALLIAIERGLKPRRLKYRDGSYGKRLPPLLTTADVKEVRGLIEGLAKPVKDRAFIREELLRFVKRQTIREMLLRSVDHLDYDDYDAIDVEINRVLEVQTIDQGGLGHFYVRDVGERIERRKTHVHNGVPTGLKVDDHLKPGGLPPGGIGVVLAATNVGKSKTLIHIGRSAIVEGGVKVLHITLEDPEDEIVDGYDAAFSGVQLSGLDLKPKTIRKAVEDVGTRYGEFLVVKEFSAATLTVPMLEQYVRALERSTGFTPGMVIIDYADEMLPTISSRNSNTYQDQGNVYRELARFADKRHRNIPVWTAAQATRAAMEDDNPDLSQMGDSWMKAKKANLVIILAQTEDEERTGFGRVIIGKNKYGAKNVQHRVRFDFSRCKIRNV